MFQKNRTACWALVALLLVVAGKVGWAEEGDAPPAFPVAVLRLDKVFKENSKLQDRLAPLKTDAAELDRAVQLRQTEIENTQAKLRGTPPTSNDHEKLQLQLARLNTELQIFVGRERQKLLQNEAQIYLDVSREVDAVVQEYCKSNGIRLVLRHQELPEGDRQNRDEVMKLLNRGVLFEDGLDITEDILKAMTERQKADSKARS